MALILHDQLSCNWHTFPQLNPRWRQVPKTGALGITGRFLLRDVCLLRSCTNSRLVSWSLTSLFSTNMVTSETKGQGWRVILTQRRKASDILTSTLAAFLFSSHPKRERDREAHLNHYASAYKREDNYHTTRQTKPNTTKSSMHP